MTSMRKINPGDRYPLSAAMHNATVDVIRTVRESGPQRNDEPFTAEDSPAIIKVRNDSGEDVPLGGNLAITKPVFDFEDNPNEFLHRITMVGELPEEDEEHAGRFAIAIEPIADGAIGNCVIAGLAIARVLASDDDQFADIDDENVEHLRGSMTGARILWLDDEDDELPRWAVLQLGGSSGSTIFPASITDGEPMEVDDVDGVPHEWVYPWEELEFSFGTGHGTQGLAVKDGGRESGSSLPLFAANPMEKFPPSDLENLDDETCPDAEEGQQHAKGLLKRMPLRPNTPVWMQEVTGEVNNEPAKRYIIVGLIGSYNPVCGYCEAHDDDEEED